MTQNSAQTHKSSAPTLVFYKKTWGQVFVAADREKGKIYG